MTTQTILVIDDSATIRKMVDSHLSQEGYRVILAPTGEQGIQLAREILPDLILLDHQLPGTTGIEVCKQIVQFPECQHIPFLVSSTLRKQAYVEYMNVPNVVDSLPKPFKPELLKMAVINALETGAMIISAQSGGTAVPEVVGETDQPAFSGDFRWLGLREVIDFLTNGHKIGMLEVETERNRICFYLGQGRIQAVVSASLNPDVVARQLPESLKELAPMLKFTMSTGKSSQIDGIVELVDRKVVDPRLLRTLLRHQAATLTRHCFLNSPKGFSFLPEREAPSIFRKCNLDLSLAAILVEGTLNCAESELDTEEAHSGWSRHALRGQNLDRTGLAAKHVQLLSYLDTSPQTSAELADKSGLPQDEVRRVFNGYLFAEWAQRQVQQQSYSVVVYEPDAQGAAIIRAVLSDSDNAWNGNVVRDEFGLQLLLKRKHPDVLLLALEGTDELQIPERIQQMITDAGSLGVITPAIEPAPPIAPTLTSAVVIRRPYSKADILRTLEQLRTEAVFSAAEAAASAQALPANSVLSEILDAVGTN